MLLDRGRLWVTETLESETMVKGGLLHCMALFTSDLEVLSRENSQPVLHIFQLKISRPDEIGHNNNFLLFKQFEHISTLKKSISLNFTYFYCPNLFGVSK